MEVIWKRLIIVQVAEGETMVVVVDDTIGKFACVIFSFYDRKMDVDGNRCSTGHVWKNALYCSAFFPITKHALENILLFLDHLTHDQDDVSEDLVAQEEV